MAVTATINVSGVAALRYILVDTTTFYFTNAVDGQKLTLTLQQDTTGSRAVASGNCPGLQQPSPTASDDSTQVLIYDSASNTWNSAPASLIGGVGPQTITYGASGPGLAINKNAGTCILTGAGVVAATLVQPVAGPPGVGDDGVILRIVSASAHAHTVITSADGIGPAADTLTFAAVGAGVSLQAYGAIWYLIGGVAVTPTEA